MLQESMEQELQSWGEIGKTDGPKDNGVGGLKNDKWRGKNTEFILGQLCHPLKNNQNTFQTWCEIPEKCGCVRRSG